MSNKVWMVTGSSRGLGREIVLAALKHGERVIATARNAASLESLAAEYGEQIYPVSMDVTDNAGVLAAVRKGLDRFGRIDVLVNNAGYANVSSIEDITIADFEQQVATNFLGVVYAAKAVLPAMRSQGGGSIINISSIGGRVGNAGLGAYQSSKFAVNGFTEVLAKEVAPFGIKVTVVEPGGIATDWAGSSMDVPPVSEPYKELIGGVARHLRGMSAASAEERIGTLSDPAKIADAVWSLAEMGDPPLHLLMGTTAYAIAQEASKRLAESDQKYEPLTKSTVYAE
ncbi:SDR family NAD(P)-dependent oxidoreductase [Paenibacillus sp. NFR01]|uniref:SDR family NAD(P)-dependent oxidoreductase n=1 Tax=Paenibacillus sp. NFR01 TaxID=1566279 RepID=UPI0008AC6A32|nr:SDR family NAD(P)-dependent oxidoreductase [Paenibacillus sp. NFR01]SET33729.1 NADP-dependent 3-hydroxy acid dehydrogenase YdfG [Paenibacillus sp. NFR01]